MNMKIVTLARPAMVNEELRQPIEGSLTVKAGEAERLRLSGVLVGDPEDVPEPDESGAEGDPEDGEDDGLDAMKLEDLGILVTKEGVPLHGATKKADIVAAIRKHRAPAA